MGVDICICTYRRESLRATLQSIASLILPQAMQIRVIVADNDATPSARILVMQVAAQYGLECEYLHAPAHNISVARNACLEAATAPLIAFIDDDEVAEPHWLAHLLRELETGACDIAFGPVQACYASDAPHWVIAADLHSIRPVIRAGERIETGYTSNVLLRRDVLGSFRFDPALGRSGGEDTCFFFALHKAGARLGYCPEAIVFEEVPAGRAQLRWLLQRSFRSGQVYGRMLAERSDSIKAPIAIAASKALYCTLGAGFRFTSAAGWRRSLVRAALHTGVVAKLLGLRELQLY